MNEKTMTQIIRDEGIRYKPYRCTAGKLTIGVGRNLDDLGISHDEVMTLLENDISRCQVEIIGNIDFSFDLDSPRFAVLTNMVFNMGFTRFLTFKKMLEALECGDYITASKEMLDSKWARGPTKNRAERLSKQMETGGWV